MTAKQKQGLMFKKLKAQVAFLKKREQASNQKLRIALSKMHQLGKVYKSKLASKIKDIRVKIAAVEAKEFAKVANAVERQLQKKVSATESALGLTVVKFDKKFAAKLAKSINKRAIPMVKKRKVAKVAKKKVVKKKAAKKSAKRPAAKRTAKKRSKK